MITKILYRTFNLPLYGLSTIEGVTLGIKRSNPVYSKLSFSVYRLIFIREGQYDLWSTQTRDLGSEQEF